MNKYIIQGAIALGLIVLFILDKSLSGVLSFFNFFSLTLVTLLILANLNTHRTFLFDFFIFGVLCDWYNRTFLGVNILVCIVGLYLFYIFKIRFHANKALMTIVNLIFSYILGIIFVGFSNILDLRVVIMSILVTATTSIIWLKD